jgi:hypothetical protein
MVKGALPAENISVGVFSRKKALAACRSFHKPSTNWVGCDIPIAFYCRI